MLETAGVGGWRWALGVFEDNPRIKTGGIPSNAENQCRSSYKGRTVDTLAPEAEEGRGRLR